MGVNIIDWFCTILYLWDNTGITTNSVRSFLTIASYVHIFYNLQKENSNNSGSPESSTDVEKSWRTPRIR